MPTHPSDPPTIDYQKCIDAIRAGGFVCLLPQLIDPSWRHPAPLLAGFPLSVCYAGLSKQFPDHPTPPLMTSSYWFDPATYREDDETRAISYFTNPPRRISRRADLLEEEAAMGREQVSSWQSAAHRARIPA